MTLGDFISKRIIDLGINQSELAHQANLSVAQISKIISDQSIPRIETAKKISKALQFQIPKELLTPKSRKHNAKIASQPAAVDPNEDLLEMILEYIKKKPGSSIRIEVTPEKIKIAVELPA